MTKGGNTKGGKPEEPAVPVDRAERDQAKGPKGPRAKYMSNNMAELYDGLFMLTIKDNANNISKADLLFLVNYCLKFCKAELVRHEFEFGKQGRIHIHAVCKAKSGKMASAIGMEKYLHKYTIFTEHTEETTDGHIITRKRLSIDSLTFNLSPITSEQHLYNVNGYVEKEQCDFTDNDGPNKVWDDIMVQFCNY